MIGNISAGHFSWYTSVHNVAMVMRYFKRCVGIAMGLQVS